MSGSSGEASLQNANRLVKGLLDLKLEGNTALSEGDASTAAAVYSRALVRLDEVVHELELPDAGATLKATFLSNRSQAQLQLEEWEEALKDAEESLRIQPENNPKAEHRRGLAEKALISSKDRREKGEALKRALFCKSEGNKLLSAGNSKSAASEYTNGLEWLEDLLGPAQPDPEVREIRVALLANRSQAYLKQSQWKEALSDASAVLSLDSNHAKAKFRKAKALLELGQHDNAIVMLRHITASDPKNEDAADLLQRAMYRARDDVAAVAAVASAHGGYGSQQQQSKRQQQQQTQIIEELKTGRDADLQNAKRLMDQSESECNAGNFQDGLQSALGAISILQKAMSQALQPQERPSKTDIFFQPSLKNAPPQTGRLEAKNLIMAYTREVMCRLSLRDFLKAKDTAERALKLKAWGEARLEEEFDLPSGLKAAATIAERLASVAQSVNSLQKGEEALAEADSRLAVEARKSASEGLQILEQNAKDWTAVRTLQAALLAVKAESTLRMGIGQGGQGWKEASVDAELALVLDPGCTRARHCLRECKSTMPG
eukprot:TRINITY_DN31363_c0_g1_i1.p1 TRINITY_DN31363_c0_g1~~TRINITY_DN31363_c0_g1_i1.p1  ORF type:complete len:548 (-),score=149.58 TRINITY_DN31363_c0_g1_i1:18-1661(-)